MNFIFVMIKFSVDRENKFVLPMQLAGLFKNLFLCTIHEEILV